MRRKISWILAMGMALALLTGCGAGEQAAQVQTAPYAAPVSTAVETAPAATVEPTPEGFRFHESTAVDDSGSFRYNYYDPAYSEKGYYNLEGYFLGEVYPAHLQQYLDDVELLDAALVSNPIRGYGLGWVCFTGTPKEELGWQTVDYKGRTAYCRGLYFLTRDGETYDLAKSYAMEPVPLMNPYRDDEAGERYLVDRVVEGLISAELYQTDSGESSVITDPAMLRRLEAALSYGESFYYGWSVGASALAGVDPLVLRFEDGSAGLVYVAADGANSCYVWGQWCAYVTGQSIFQLMGVDRSAAGYVTNADGSVKSTAADKAVTTREAQMGDEIPTFHVRYDADGRRIQDQNDFEGAQGTRIVVHSYRYDETGRLAEDQVTVDGEPSAVYTAEFDEQGRLHSITTDMLTQGRYSYEHRYDEQGRLSVIVFHNGDGSEGMPTGNRYFWYDEQNHRHQYGFDENGNLTGGPRGDGGDNPIRR